MNPIHERRAERQAENEPLLRSEEKIGSYVSAPIDEKTSDDSEVLCCKTQPYLPTPLPVKQLAIIFIMRLAEPIAYSQVFPVHTFAYINEMMENIGAVEDPKEAGYYSGITESAFAFAELMTVMKWGSLSDHVGRKPVLMIGFTGAMLSTLLFGLSRSFFWALTTRCLAGGLSGNVAVLLSAVGDMTDDSNQARAFAVFGLANNIAHMAGPTIGGTFANPTITFPESIGRVPLFQSFPFLLPCLISSFITFVALCCSALFFEESLHREQSNARSTPVSHDPPAKSSTLGIATDPLMLSVLTPFFLLSVLNTSLNVVFSLFAYTPVFSGGLSRNPEEIGLAIAFAGLAGAIIQVTILPELQHRYGTIYLYRFFMSLWPLIYLLFPVLNAIARNTIHGNGEGGYRSQPAGLLVWCIVAIMLSLGRLASMSYSLNLMLTKNAAPSAAVLGKVFALSHFINCVARAIAPAFVSSLFAVSEERNLLNGNLVWLVMYALGLLGICATFEARDGAAK